MSSHTNRSVSHDFYYRGVDEGRSGDYRGCSISYSRRVARSYSTVVAQVIPAKGYRDGDVRTREPSSGRTLVSTFTMSNTTGRHIGYLRSSSPFECISVPMRRGGGELMPQELANRFYEELGYYVKELNTKANREEFMHMLNALKRVRDEASEEWAKPLRHARFRRFLKVDVSKEAEALKARNRRLAAKAARETRETIAKYVKDRKGGDYCEFMHALFDPRYESGRYRFSDRQREILRDRVCGGKHAWDIPAYVWLDGDEIETSKGVRVPVSEAKVAMRLWASGKDMRTLPVDRYHIVSYEGDTIQIGCHKIPRENMLALYEAVMGEPFPERKA